MAHKKIIDSVKKQGQVTIKDLDVQSCRDLRSSTKRLTELPLKGAGKTLFLTAAKTRRIRIPLIQRKNKESLP